MRPAGSLPFGDFLVFVDESGDHHLSSINPQYPVFVLAFAIIRKSDYIEKICPDLQRFKLNFWSHDEVVLHEHDIRKPKDVFSFLMRKPDRERFLADLNGLMAGLPAAIIAVAIDKVAFAHHHAADTGAYDYAMSKGLNAVFRYLAEHGQTDALTPIIVECRGNKEDGELEVTFRRHCDTTNAYSRSLPLELVMVQKTANSAGLQLADLIARPIGLHVLRPDQPNRAFDIIQPKLYQGEMGIIHIP